jgi:hypothetical protein
MPKRRARRPERREHRPAWSRKTCNACGQPVIMAEEDTGGGRLKGALLESAPAPAGVLVRRADGYVVRDPQRTLSGTRYAWHHCPVRNSPPAGGTT